MATIVPYGVTISVFSEFSIDVPHRLWGDQLRGTFFREVDSSSANLEIPRIVWNWTVHCRVHKSQLPTLSQINPVHCPPPPFYFVEVPIATQFFVSYYCNSVI